MLTISVLIPAKPGKGDALGAALRALLEPTRAEKGCLSYDAHRSNDDPDLYLMHENWESEDALRAHFDTPHLQDFVATKLPELVEGDLDLRKFTRL